MANHNDTTGSGALFMAFLAGAMAGAAVALLFAPAKGEDAREFLGERVREGREKAAEAARRGRDMFNRERENFSSTFDRARDQYEPGSTGEDQET